MYWWICIFKIFFCPAIVTPSSCGIVPVPPSEQAQRALVLVAKVLQNIANNVTFGSKETFLEFMNPFITANVLACQDYFDQIARLDEKKQISVAKVSLETKNKSLEAVYKQTKNVFPKIKEKCAEKSWFKELQILMDEILQIEIHHGFSKPKEPTKDSSKEELMP